MKTHFVQFQNHTANFDSPARILYYTSLGRNRAKIKYKERAERNNTHALEASKPSLSNVGGLKAREIAFKRVARYGVWVGGGLSKATHMLVIATLLTASTDKCNGGNVLANGFFVFEITRAKKSLSSPADRSTTSRSRRMNIMQIFIFVETSNISYQFHSSHKNIFFGSQANFPRITEHINIIGA